MFNYCGIMFLIEIQWFPKVIWIQLSQWTFSYISILSVVVFVVPNRALVGRGGLENLVTGHGTWYRAEVVGEVVIDVWSMENIPRMSAVRGNRPVRQHHVGSPLKLPSPPGGWADPERIVTVWYQREFLCTTVDSFSSPDAPLSFGVILRACERIVCQRCATLPHWTCRRRWHPLLVPLMRLSRCSPSRMFTPTTPKNWSYLSDGEPYPLPRPKEGNPW